MAGTEAMGTMPFTATARAGIMAGIAAITTAGTSTARAITITTTTTIAITDTGADCGFRPAWN